MASCLSSICKFGSFKKLLVTITGLFELYFRFRRFILLVQAKKNDFHELWQQYKLLKTWRWVRFDLILAMRDIYIISNLNPLTWKFTSSSRSIDFKDILLWNISISMRIVISYAMKWGILFLVYWKVSGNWDYDMIRISQWRESQCRTNTCARRKKETQKSRTVSERHSQGSE